MVNIHALIVTFKRKDLLEVVIESVLAQSTSVTKIIIVDNNSNDGTDALVNKLKQNSKISIDYYNTGANLGGAGGFSFGFDTAMKEKFDYLWIMDDDIAPQPNCLEKLLESASKDRIVQPIRYNLDGTCAEYSPVIFDLSSIFLMRPKRETVVNRVNCSNEKEIPLNGIPFEGPLIPRGIIEKIGLPDRRFFIFYDDLDYALRARQAGFNIICKTDAIATRLLMNNQVTDLQSWKGYFMLRNFFHIHHKHGENIFVRLRPTLFAMGFIFKELLLFRRKSAVICFHAFIDSIRKDFKIRMKYVP